MLTVTIDTSEVTRAWAAEMRNLEQGAASLVMEAADAGKAIARVMVPHRSYALRKSIEARPNSSGAEGAEAVIEFGAQHASFVRDGTDAHAILPRKKRFLRFVAGGGVVFSRGVMHPGTRANRAFWVETVEVVELRLVRAGNALADGVAARMSLAA
jgi:hypothetical protein